MPKGSRRAQKSREGHRELNLDLARGGQRIENATDGAWNVRSNVTSPDKTYRCPGCQQTIESGVAHIVAWSAAGLFGDERALAERRHWHTACWRERGRRH